MSLEKAFHREGREGTRRKTNYKPCQIARVVKGGKTAGLNVLTNWEQRMPWLLAQGVRWLNVRVNTFIARGARQYTDLLKRSVDAH